MPSSQSNTLLGLPLTSPVAYLRSVGWSGRRAGGDWLALEWDDQHVTVAEGRVSSGRVRMKRCFRAQWPADLQVWEMPDRAGVWLREELAKAGVTARRVAVLLPRERVVLKQLQVPSASEEELPDLVYFQAGIQSALPVDDVCLDFLPPRNHKDESICEVLAATVPRSLVAGCCRVTAAAGLELSSIGISSLAAGEVLVRVLHGSFPSDELAVLLNSRGQGRVEISLLSGDLLAYSCSTSVSGENPESDSQAVLAATKRMMIARKLPDRDPKIGRVWLLGSTAEDGSFAEALARHFDCPVRAMSPFDAVDLPPRWPMPGMQSQFSVAIGGLLTRSGAALPGIDFLAPRKRATRGSWTGPRRLVRVALLACVAASLGFFQWNSRLCNLDRQIKQLGDVEKDLQAQIKKGAATLKTADLLDSWTSSNLHWLDETLLLTERMPSGQQIYLSTLQFDGQRESSPASLRASGYARDRDEVIRLTERLLEDRSHYELQPPSIRPSPQDSDYPVRFDLETRILSSETPPLRIPESESDRRGQE